MDAIDRYLERLAEPGMRAYLRELYVPAEEKADQPPARRRTVAAAEKKLGVRLPPSYTKLVTTLGPYDGGYEVWWIEDPVGPGADLVSANRTRLAPSLISVVPVLSGDSFCFDTRRADERGEYPIVRFDHEIHTEESTDFETVASDLGEFLLGCLPEAVPPEAVASAARVAGGPGLSWVRNARWFWRRQRRRLGRAVEATSAVLTSLRAAPAPRTRPGTEVSPLGAAIKDNDIQRASELLASGADPNAVTQFTTPLEQALIGHNREIIRLLIDYGADLRALDGRTPLQKAFERDPELGAWLFRQLPDPTVLDAAEAGTLDDLRKLVDAGGDVNMVSQDRRRFSPLQAAALRGDVEIARFLLERGADLNYRGAWERPAVVIAATSAYSARMTEFLLSRGADPNATDPDGHTLLYEVATSYWFDVQETLIRAGADVNSRAPDGSTPLHQAAARNSDAEARAIHTLVQHGAKLDAQDNQGFTPLHAALERTMADAARMLLDLGADPTIRDHEGRTPVELIGVGAQQYPGIPEVIRRIAAWARPKD